MLYVRKRDGRIEPFTKDKIISTCLKAGGSYDVCEKIAKEIERRFSGIIDSKFLLEFVKKKLKSLGLYEAYIRYPLKQALYELEGKEFEWYASRLLELEGYKVKKEESIIIKGKCIEHEIDILAFKDNKEYIIECKHHIDIQILTDLTAVMKHYARFLDIKHNFKNPIPMLITNTKFTPHAIRYARCQRIYLLGWNVPYNHGINSIIEKHKAYPLTLFGIDKFYRDALRDKGIITSLDLYYKWDIVEKIIPKYLCKKIKRMLGVIYNSFNQ